MKKFYLLLLTLFLIGCSHTKEFNYSDFRRDFVTNLDFYYQYEKVNVYHAGGKQIVVSKPFLADEDKFLSKSTVILRIGIYINNPKKKNIVAWANQEILSLEADKTHTTIRSIIPTKRSKDEFISFDMPLTAKTKSQVYFFVDVELDDKIIFSTASARYKIGNGGTNK